MSDYRVSLKVRNNRIMEAIERKGEKFGQKFCKKHGLSYHMMLDLINLKITPLDSELNIRPQVEKLMEITGCMLSELFSDEQIYFTLESNSVDFISSDNQMCDFIENSAIKKQQNTMLRLAVESLPKREASIIKDYFGFGAAPKSMNEIAISHGVSQTRIVHIQHRALRMLRHPKNREKFGYDKDDLQYE